MSCESCSNNKNGGIPNGCQNNGHCATGGCSKLGVFDWLADIQPSTGKSVFDVVEVSFKNGRKNFYRNEKGLQLFQGETVVVEASPGHDVGIVTLTGELVKHQMNRKGVNVPSRELRKIYRKATEADFEKWKDARSKEYETMHQARELAILQKLDMKLGDVEYQGDGSKATFYYTADQRVDFRELIKLMAEKFKIKIEMRQIGARQEAGRLGGIGACGRELCCSTWLTDFRSVSTGAARYQQLSLNPQKLAGQCGKLKCCLNFELDQYAEELKSFPDVRRPLETAKGTAINIKTDVFKRLMWFLVQGEQVGGSSIICLTVDKVFEIQELNKKGIKPGEIATYIEAPVTIEEPKYDNVVGQDDLNRFDDKFKKKGKDNRPQNQNKKPNPNQQNRPTGNQSNQPARPKLEVIKASDRDKEPKTGESVPQNGTPQNGTNPNRNKNKNRNKNRNKNKGNNPNPTINNNTPKPE
jgi:cell fate regulator YaaT (PSP1 superfamily)